jgi:hypothetical protein
MARQFYLFLALSLAIAAGTARSDDVSQKPTVAPGSAREKTSKAARDAAILETVLLDIPRDRKDFNPYSPIDERTRTNKRIYFSFTPRRYRPKVADILVRYEPTKWKNLSLDQHRQAKEAAESLVQRVRNNDYPRSFVSRNKRILLWTHRNAKKDRQFDLMDEERRFQVFDLYPPGYSRDALLAVVYMGYPWSGYHSGIGTYLLTLHGGKWKILLRQFIVYP